MTISKADEIGEAMVDTFRALRAINDKARESAASIPAPPSTPGAGRSCRPGRFVPAKRIKALHRSQGRGASLKAFALLVIDQQAQRDSRDVRSAVEWLRGKAVRS